MSSEACQSAIIFYLPSPISQQRINLAEVSYLDLDSLQGVYFISDSIFSDNYNLAYQ